jgi:hypothetical protein
VTDQHRLVATASETELVLHKIVDELIRAEQKFPNWPDDLVHGVAIVAEESGEAVRGCLRLVYEGDTENAYRVELIRTAAVCVRALVDLDRRAENDV